MDQLETSEEHKLISPLSLFAETSGWRFATSLGNWGPLFAAYYEAAREELPNEKKFWISLIKKNFSVLEIGAGSGFISEALASTKPKLLTLIEPEPENIKLLNKNISKWNSKTNIDVVTSQFETANVSPHDLIIFPYDSLPMISSRIQRADLFRIIANRLTPNGIFGIHISTPLWSKKYVQSTRELAIQKYITQYGQPIEVKRFFRAVSGTEYIKFISIKNEQQETQENYVALTSIIFEEEIFESAKLAGLKLIHRYSDFYGTPYDPISGPIDDDIFVFAKESP